MVTDGQRIDELTDNASFSGIEMTVELAVGVPERSDRNDAAGPGACVPFDTHRTRQ